MRYFVLGPDGKPYGPVDVGTLKQWVAQGRVVRGTTLREEGSGVEFPASALAELWQGAPEPLRDHTSRVCRNCGAPVAAGQGICGRCGARADGEGSGRLMTGSEGGDRFIGFVVGFGSFFVFGIGFLGGLLVYLLLRRSLPELARGIGYGLTAMVVLILGLLAVCAIVFTTAGVGR